MTASTPSPWFAWSRTSNVQPSSRLGKTVILADERAMSRRHSPFRTVGTLSELLYERLGEAA